MRLSPLLFTDKKRKPIKRDPQRHKVYGMERTALVGMSVHTSSPNAHLQAVARHACKTWKVPSVKVLTYNESEEHTFGHASFKRILLNAGYHGSNVATLLHELAHYIEWHLHGDDDEPDHGPRFMYYYIELMDRYRLLPRNAFKLICDECDVEYLEKSPKA